MTSQIIRGNALTLPLADASVDLVITSPPYFGLRSYQDDGEHYAGQLGSEATPAEFVDALLAATREMVRVLKPSGSLWINLGDKYAGHTGGTRTPLAHGGAKGTPTKKATAVGAPEKSLIGIPWRYAIACIDQLGLILRAEIIWAKPNGLPESVTDRVRRSHEQWFHFVKQPRYFSAVDEIREEAQTVITASGAVRYRNPGETSTLREKSVTEANRYTGTGMTGDVRLAHHPLGKLPGSVWSIPTQPLTVPPHLGVDHFAAFPMEWPRRIIQGWSPAGVCTGCGEGRRPVAERSAIGPASTTARGGGNSREKAMPDFSHINRSEWREGVTYDITGYACACPDPTAPTTPSVILDPFGGTGTVALVTRALGRHGISLDMSADYCRLAAWRITDESELARALQVDKPAKQVDGQMSLLEGMP